MTKHDQNEPLPSQEILREMFDYDSESGALTWKSHRPDTYHDDPSLIAGMVWKWMTGEDPDGPVGHIDNNSKNNRWSNLRVADKSKKSRRGSVRKKK